MTSFTQFHDMSLAALGPREKAGAKLDWPARARESEHRIKNHLQLIGSSLALQARGCDNQETREILLQAQGRVSAVARLHARLQDLPDADEVEVSDFLGEVCADLRMCFGAPGTVSVEANLESRTAPAGKVLTLGLIVNELVTNSVKHSPAGRALCVCVSLKPCDTGWRLSVEDDGPGMPADALTHSPDASLGTRLLHGLAKQLGGVLQVGPVATGACVFLDFP